MGIVQSEHLHVRVEQIDGFEFRIRFDDDRWRDLVVDESAPLSRGAGPSPSHVLGAAIADCLCASFLFCLKKAEVPAGPIDADVDVEISRNAEKRLRVTRINVTLRPTIGLAEEAFTKCLRDFEDYCVVTQAVREGIEIRVAVEPIVEGPYGPTA